MAHNSKHDCEVATHISPTRAQSIALFSEADKSCTDFIIMYYYFEGASGFYNVTEESELQHMDGMCL